MKVLYLIPDLAYDGAARQLSLLAANLPADLQRRVVVLGSGGGFAAGLAAAGVAVDCLGWRSRFDIRPWLRLRAIWRDFRPDVVHAWRPLALRAVRALGRWRGPLVLSAPFPRGQRPAQTGIFDRWLLRGATRIVARSDAEAAACRRLGVSADRLATIPPGVAAAPEPAPRARLEEIVGGKLGAARVMVCLGRQERHKGYRDAIWAFDILRYVVPNCHLVLIGDGPYQERLRNFIDVTGLERQVHLAGQREDGPELLAAADVVWVPSVRSGGLNVALEAMAAGRPLVAANLPELAELVKDGQSGVLYPAGDQPALARQTKLLLENEEQRRWLGAAAQGHARQRFPVADMVERYVKVYQSLVGK